MGISGNGLPNPLFRAKDLAMDQLIYGLGLLTLIVLAIFFLERVGPVLWRSIPYVVAVLMVLLIGVAMLGKAGVI